MTAVFRKYPNGVGYQGPLVLIKHHAEHVNDATFYCIMFRGILRWLFIKAVEATCFSN